MPKIGLKKAYYAVQTSDVEGAAVYNAPVALANMQQVQVNPKVSNVQVPGDDIIVEEISECLGADIVMQRSEITPQEEAILLGRPVDTDGGAYGGTFDNAPNVAFGYMRTFKNSNVGLYVWLFKVKFKPSNSTADTKPVDSVNPQYDSLGGAAITRTADGAWIYSVKSSDPNFAATFFTKAKLETLANVASQVYGQPADVESVGALPGTGTAGIIYHLTTDDTFHYWDGSDFVEIS
jgi:phi13 family phage major tail protein